MVAEEETSRHEAMNRTVFPTVIVAESYTMTCRLLGPLKGEPTRTRACLCHLCAPDPIHYGNSNGSYPLQQATRSVLHESAVCRSASR